MPCKDCDFRKFIAAFDIHIDWRDCWQESCKHKKKKEKESVESG